MGFIFSVKKTLKKKEKKVSFFVRNIKWYSTVWEKKKFLLSTIFWGKKQIWINKEKKSVFAEAGIENLFNDD